MVTPAKGDYASLPISNEGRRVADTWDPAKDEKDGNACKSYGAAAIMRVPGRVHITWQDESTLKIETDAGTQTRLLHFGDAAAAGGRAGMAGLFRRHLGDCRRWCERRRRWRRWRWRGAAAVRVAALRAAQQVAADHQPRDSAR